MARAKTTELVSLQEKLGYTFKNISQLERALTHKSALDKKQMQHAQAKDSYQRLEFLGDRVLALVIADSLLKEFPDAQEGELARRLTGLVRNETCADVARELDFGQALVLGASESSAGGREKDNILGDVCEAVIAAIYLDGGIEAARPFIERNWHQKMRTWSKPLRDAKTTLQEWAHGRQLPTPEYIELERSGPDHSLTFVIEVKVKGRKSAKAQGTSKREAQQRAASNLLVAEGIWQKDREEA